MGRFIADPDVLLPEGNKINGISSDFFSEIENVYATADNMVRTEYLSPEALAIKKEMDEKRKDLEEMAKVMGKYGNYCINSGNKVVNNQEEVIDQVQGGQGN